MSVDMHEHKFILELEALQSFVTPLELDRRARAIDFPAWRAVFTSLLLHCHSTGYRLPDLGEFITACEATYCHERHGRRFSPFFEGRWRDRTLARLALWYESGLVETYVYVCLVDAIEDVLRDGLVFYDPRVDWKHKWDAVVVRGGVPVAVNVHRGSVEDRVAVERSRDAVEHQRKQNTRASSHWANSERESWSAVSLAVDVDDVQVVNGLRLPSVRSMNRLLDEIYALTGPGDFSFPHARAERKELYLRLVGR